MRAILNILLLIPMGIGAAVGIVVSPFAIGFMIAYEYMAADVYGAFKRMEAKRKAREQSNT